MNSHWQKSQVRCFCCCCTADLQADEDQNQLNNNLEIDEFEPFTSDMTGYHLAILGCRRIIDSDDPRLRGSGLPLQLKNELEAYRDQLYKNRSSGKTDSQ